MDELKGRLQKAKAAQAQLASEFSEIVREYESQDFIQENEQLRKDYALYEKQVHELKKMNRDITDENSRLRYALQEQMLDEKLNILKVSQEKLRTYFGKGKGSRENRLQELEQNAKRDIEQLKQRASKNLGEEKHEILAALERFSNMVEERIRQHKELMNQREEEVAQGVSAQYGKLAAEEVTEEMMQKRMKQNQVEMKIGLSWINRIGILLIILGVGAAFRYTYATWFNDYFKGATFFLLGGLMLAGGEWLYRKQQKTFALGLIGGGIAVLYGSIFFSYFLLNIIGMPVALILSILVTAAAVLLSLRYHSRTVCTFGLIGGYIPLYSFIIAFGVEGSAVYAAMGYVIVLNLFIMWISFQRQWKIVHYISFVLNMPTMLLLIALSGSPVADLMYSVLTFLLYLSITLSFPFKHSKALKIPDVILLGLNTFISCTVIYDLFDELEWNSFRGLLAVIFCLVYFGLGRFAEKKLSGEHQTKLLFYATSLTFAILVIPFQFGIAWVSIGWLAEALILMIYGYTGKQKALQQAGWVIYALCLFSFLFTAAGAPIGLTDFFDVKYTAITAGLILVPVFYLLQQKKHGSLSAPFRSFRQVLNGLKYTSLVNGWIYLLYESVKVYRERVPADFDQYQFYLLMLEAFLAVGLGYLLPKVTLLYDRFVRYYALFLHALGCLIGLAVTVSIPVLEPGLEQNTFIHYLALVLLIGFNLLIFFTGRDLLLSFIRKQYKNVELYPTVLSVYLLGILAAFLYVQFRLGDVGVLASTIFLAVAIGYIFYGFKKQYVYIRRIGLGITLLSTGKLILFDLAFLTEGSRIIAYFCFGIALLAISYMYQKVSSRQEAQQNVSAE
ncbi:DUF2339 domain-containing protein [Bacillus sp. FJAT-42376]|uniref:DUF2339 domain-containing protein n=1 Tax=Bacillus sp. FJAT-42376 TaxID=2014076 RepID=UPI000F4F1AD0|nr:DUF2339 domain-containing protein [Bacillus sp. FJAT-42376]AZB41032.1 DUF2339 domain-containing protein [Bacillus sp. FJAT-42376]